MRTLTFHYIETAASCFKHTFVISLKGQSGSGKSTLTKALVESYCPKGKKVYVLNDSTKNPAYDKVGWESTELLQDCGLVVEDLISASNAQVDKIKHLLSFAMHHKRVSPIVCVCHAIQKNNIFPMLQMFNKVYVSAVKPSESSLTILMRYYGIDKQIREKMLATLAECKEEFAHFVIDIKKRIISFNELTDAQRQSIERQLKAEGARGYSHEETIKAKTEAAKNNAIKFLALLPEKKREYGLFLFSMIYNKFSESVDTTDLTISLSRSSKGGKRTVKMSLIDLIFELLDDKNGKVTPRMQALFLYLKEKGSVVLPKSFILNREFLKSIGNMKKKKSEEK